MTCSIKLNYNSSIKLNGGRMNKLKSLIASRGFTQLTLAKQLGCTNTTISMWCNCKSQPRPAMIQKLVSILDIDYETIFAALECKEVEK